MRDASFVGVLTGLPPAPQPTLCQFSGRRTASQYPYEARISHGKLPGDSQGTCEQCEHIGIKPAPEHTTPHAAELGGEKETGGSERIMATLGIDIGCISVKMALVGSREDRELFASRRHESTLFATEETEGMVAPDGDPPPILITRYQRIKGTPADTTNQLLEDIAAEVPEYCVTGIRVTQFSGTSAAMSSRS